MPRCRPALACFIVGLFIIEVIVKVQLALVHWWGEMGSKVFYFLESIWNRGNYGTRAIV